MKPKYKGWKEGIITEDLINMGGTGFKKGDTVRYRRFKEYDIETHTFTGSYEWHYTDINNTTLVRTSEFLIKLKL